MQSRGKFTARHPSGHVGGLALEAPAGSLLGKGAPVKVPDELKPYLGTFYASFGRYKNTPFQVVFRNGRLAVDIPDQLVFGLLPPELVRCRY